MARRLVRSHKNDMSDREGNKASSTLGMVSPTMTQNATIPPKALYDQHLPRCPLHPLYVQYPLGQRNGNEPRLAKAMLDSRLERVGAAQFRVDDYKLDSPIDGHGEADQEESAC